MDWKQDKKEMEVIITLSQFQFVLTLTPNLANFNPANTYLALFIYKTFYKIHWGIKDENWTIKFILGSCCSVDSIYPPLC